MLPTALYLVNRRGSPWLSALSLLPDNDMPIVGSSPTGIGFFQIEEPIPLTCRVRVPSDTLAVTETIKVESHYLWLYDLSLRCDSKHQQWSSEQTLQAVILARGTGSVTVSSIKTLNNLLGNQPEWFEPAPRISGVHDGGFLGLEVGYLILFLFCCKMSLLNLTSSMYFKQFSMYA